jgi:hypothetical protein
MIVCTERLELFHLVGASLGSFFTKLPKKFALFEELLKDVAKPLKLAKDVLRALPQDTVCDWTTFNLCA